MIHTLLYIIDYYQFEKIFCFIFRTYCNVLRFMYILNLIVEYEIDDFIICCYTKYVQTTNTLHIKACITKFINRLLLIQMFLLLRNFFTPYSQSNFILFLIKYCETKIVKCQL
jgi:hypothetical protein